MWKKKQFYKIISISKECPESFSKQLSIMGFIPNNIIYVKNKAPFNGPIALIIQDTTVSLRRNDLKFIKVIKI